MTTLVLILLASLFSILLTSCIWVCLLVYVLNDRKTIDEKPFKQRIHKEKWCRLWSFILRQNNIVRLPDGSINGGNTVEKLRIILSNEFGRFNSKQIDIITYIVLYLNELSINQNARRFINMNKPSAN